jgi:DNA-binding NtrC family response regulator
VKDFCHSPSKVKGLMPHIITLSVGRDPLLLQTRGQVLRSDGYTVSSTFSAEQARQQFKAGDFDIVILCHSIPARERERLADAIHSHSPNTPVVVVAAGYGSKDRAADAVIDNEPATLLQELPKLLHKPPENYRNLRKEA